jgi:ribosomal protein L32
MCTLEDELRVWMYGAKKYAAWNWAKGMDWSVPFACAMRHLAAWQRGEDIDPESGQSHLAHAMCNLRMLTLYTKNYPEGDDRPKEWLAPRLEGEALKKQLDMFDPMPWNPQLETCNSCGKQHDIRDFASCPWCVSKR